MITAFHLSQHFRVHELHTVDRNQFWEQRWCAHGWVCLQVSRCEETGQTWIGEGGLSGVGSLWTVFSHWHWICPAKTAGEELESVLEDLPPAFRKWFHETVDSWMLLWNNDWKWNRTEYQLLIRMWKKTIAKSGNSISVQQMNAVCLYTFSHKKTQGALEE